ncbi:MULTISPECIES: hypothetical protein [unclassified Brenneria]|uniref:AbiJ-NTD4 domain-containing protein n=1 Tax=unclassified Brenneria TaxID=2634434 RepID=UPI0029C35DD3|nr:MULTISPECIES: hypothetical protein [unclassified Brenneria]MDX5630328.1 hypothetical protein [Brenneria sp. L3-3Z]MDX5697473.1 hypothetical protein [Brenneria sp. L4-2C]
MPSFSQRMGIRPMQKAIQRESMDNELRIGLWNVLQIYVWDKWKTQPDLIETLSEQIWAFFFKKEIDSYPDFYSSYSYQDGAHEIFKKYILKGQWYDVYDFVEAILKRFPVPDHDKKNLIQALNFVFETENSAYRIIENEIVEITDNQEIEAIEDAISNSPQSAKAHLQRALELLSDRKQPDYRNSIKESISAVESVCNTISGDSKGTLGKSLKQIETSISLHPSLKNAFSSLYGYTSDSGGIRHALMDESAHPSFADAKFMLVACSAFCNYLWTKVAENGR